MNVEPNLNWESRKPVSLVEHFKRMKEAIERYKLGGYGERSNDMILPLWAADLFFTVDDEQEIK